MTERKSVFIYGHSFSARLASEARGRRMSIGNLLGVAERNNVVIESHPGLTYARIFSNPEHYFHKLQAQGRIDLLCVDMGTNDLCSTASQPSMVVRDTLTFLDTLQERRIFPKRVVFYLFCNGHD